MRSRSKRIYILIAVVFAVLTTSAVLVTNRILKNNKKNDLINISELSEEFMDNYFEEYNKLTKEEKEEMLIVISKEKINAKDYGAKKVIETPNNKYYLLFENDLEKEKAVTKLNNNDSVSSIDENRIIEFFVDDDKTYNSWGIKETGIDKGISMISGIDAKEVTVAILDTGLDVDLFNKYYLGKIKETYNVLSSDNSMYDNVGHGTHIAGTIAEGTPDNVKIIPVKISDFMRISETDILAGIEYITFNKKADVINMSFGGYTYSEAQYLAIEAARQNNIIVVAAAGNESSSEPAYPASYDNTISISSVDENLTLSDFSNYGTNIDFAAPGGQINSLMASYMELSENTDGDDDHETISGTSMATPHAVAAVAILKSFNKDLTLENVVDLLKNNVIDLGTYGYDYNYGYGLINFKDVILCDNNVSACDDFNIFKVYEPNSMTISEVNFTNYNYGSITNLFLSTVNFDETDGYSYQKKLWELDDVSITGYDPYSVEKQNVTIKYLDFETTIEIQNPTNYELGWEYSLHDGLYYLSGYKDSGLEIDKLYIPEKINDLTISGIISSDEENSNLFYNSSDAKYFTEIIIPEEIIYLGNYAFSGMPNVNKVTIENSEIEFGIGSFSNMPFLTTIEGDITLLENNHALFKDDTFLKNITISNSTTIIPQRAFENCNGLNSLIIPDSVITIDDYAFLNSGLNNVTFSKGLKEIRLESFKGSKIDNLLFPESLEKIGDYAFSETAITTIEIPKNVNDIGIAPFSNNYIESIIVNPENTYYDSRDNSNLIIETSTNKIVQGSIFSVIPSSVLIIGEASYSGFINPPNSGLFIEKSLLFTSLEIPEGVTTIEKDAFLNSVYLGDVILPESINSIEDSAFTGEFSGIASIYGEIALWVHEGSYAYNYVINNNKAYVIIENSSVAEIIDGFHPVFEDRIYYPYETVDNVEGIFYYYFDYSTEEIKYVEIPNYTISYQNDDSFRYGDDKFYFNFSIENGPQNVKRWYDVVVEKGNLEIEIPVINLLKGERILDIITVRNDYGFGIEIDGGNLYFNDLHAFEEAGDYTVKGYFIANDSNYNDIWDLDIPIHVIDKRYIAKEVKISTKIKDGTTYVDPETITLSGLDKSNYTVVSAYLDSANYIGNDAIATVKIRLNDDVYENYAFTGDQQEAEWTTTMTVIDFEIPEYNLLIGEHFEGSCFNGGCLDGYGSISFEEPGDYTIEGYFRYDDGSATIEDILIPVHVINKRIVWESAEIIHKEYDGTTNIDLSTITLHDIDKSQYTIISAELESPDVSEWAMAKIKVKLNDTFYEKYAFRGDKQEAEWYNLIVVKKAIPEYSIPTNLKAKLGQKLSDIQLPTGFEWVSEDETFEEIGKKTYQAKYTPEDTNNYEIVENIDISIEVLSDIINYTSSDYSGIYDDTEHTININVLLENYDIKYSLDNVNYNISELPKFKEVGEHTIYYKITAEEYDEIIGSNKVNIYGIKGFNDSIKVKNNILTTTNTNFSDLQNNIDVYSLSKVFSHLDNKKNIITENTIKTGEYINIKINDSKDFEYELAFMGDINGDGAINSADLLKIRQHLLGSVKLTGAYFIASDINYDNTINSADLLRVRQHLLGTKPIM